MNEPQARSRVPSPLALTSWTCDLTRLHHLLRLLSFSYGKMTSIRYRLPKSQR